MGTNSLPIDHRMKYQILLLAVTLALLVTQAQAKKKKKDVSCKNRRGSITEKIITLNANETLKFATRGKKYNPDLSCVGEYMLGSCQQASISCPKFKVSNNNGIDECTDALIIGFNGDQKTYCGNEGPKNFKPDGDFYIVFESDSDKEKGKGWGVGCTVSCADGDGGDDDNDDDGDDDDNDDDDGGDETKECNCGLAVRAKRIVGGEETEVSEYPWQVGMVSTGYNRVWCGGSVISDQWILTAAHCVTGDSPSDIEVLLGEHDYKDNSETNAIRAKITEIISHPNYNGNTYDMDFALLKLKKKIDFSANSHIRPICLPDNVNELYTNAEAIVTGWGTTSSGGSLSSTLQEVMVKVTSNSDCDKDYGGSGMITSNMICAKRSGKDSCQGDSGGPLVSSNGGDGVTAGQNYEQVGVVSWGYGCAHPSYPGVYARTTTQLDWIKSKTGSSWSTCPRK